MAAVTALATPLPLDRVLWVRVEVDDEGPVGAVVAGVRRRRPVSVRVSVDLGLSLVEDGIPLVTRRVGTTS